MTRWTVLRDRNGREQIVASGWDEAAAQAIAAGCRGRVQQVEVAESIDALDRRLIT